MSDSTASPAPADTSAGDCSDRLCPTCGGAGMLCTEAFIGFRNDLCPTCKGARYVPRDPNPMAHTPASGSVPPVVLPIDSENHSERK